MSEAKRTNGKKKVPASSSGTEKNEGHAMMAKSKFSWNAHWVAPKGLRENPVFPFKHEDEILAELVKLPSGEYSVRLTKFVGEVKAK